MSEVTTSVVMAARDAGPSLLQTLDSVLAQTDPDFEFICVDDGSRDETSETLSAYARREARIRVITNPTSMGLTRSLITGCAAARGRFVARQDAGDLSHPRRLERQRACLDGCAELAFVSCWTQFVGPELEHLYVGRGTGLALAPTRIIDMTREHGIVDGPTCHPSVMFRREAYELAGGYRRQFYFGQDWDLWYRMATIGSFQIVPETLYSARVTLGGVSSAWREAQERLARLSHAAMLARARGEAEDTILEMAEKIGPHGGRPRSSGHEGLYFVGEALRLNGDRRARRYFLRSVARRPSYLKAWVRLMQTFLP